MSKCLYCYKPLGAQEQDFHKACSRKMFDRPDAPILPYTEAQMESLALQIVQSQITVTGVQPKLSLSVAAGKEQQEPRKLTIVGMWGHYILKPPSLHYPQLPEVEDLTMHLASLAKIPVVPHSLIRMQSGNLAYITRRIDRSSTGMLHMEDMCQITNRLTEHKYRGSHEQIAKAIQQYSATSGLDLVNFFELVLFSFLTGNADMHLKNFSLIQRSGNDFVLSPAYDLVSTALVNPADTEDLALSLNGKKNKITRKDFTHVLTSMDLDPKQQENIFKKMEHAGAKWRVCIQESFLSASYKQVYTELLRTRFARLEMKGI